MEINRNEAITVNGTSAVVLSVEKDNANVKRESIILINTSTGGQKITIAIDAEASANAGIVLSPGGSWNDSRDGNYYPTQKLITAISDIAGGRISLQERATRSDL